MPWLIGKRTRTKQPTRFVGIDYSNPIAQRKWVAIVIPGVAVFGTAYPKGSLKTNTTITPFNIGNSIYQSGYAANSGFSLGNNAGLKSGISSGIIVARMIVNSALNMPLFRVGSGVSKASDFYVGVVDNPAFVRILSANIVELLRTSNSVAYAKAMNVAWSYNNSSGRARIALNGVLSSAEIATTLDNSGESVICGYDLSSSTETNPGAVSLFALSDTEMSDADLIAASKNPWALFEPEPVPLWIPAVASVQVARPVSDISNTGWLPSSGSDLYPMVSEMVRDDGTYIFASAVGAICELDLADLADPGVSTGHLPTLVLSAPGGGGITVRLRQGTTTIAAWTYHPGTTPTEYTPTLSGGEADSITDYTALRFQFEAVA